MKDGLMRAALAACLLALVAPAAHAQSALVPCSSTQCFISVWNTTQPGIAYSLATSLTRLGGSTAPLSDFTVAAELVARNGPGVNQWAFGAATEAWAMAGSQSVLVGVEAAVINLEPTNEMPKVANNAVMKNRADGDPDPGQPMNHNSVAYFVSAQPGTGFEHGLMFDRDSLLATSGRPAAIDLSSIPDELIGQIDLIRIRKDVALRYDPATKQLVLHVDPPPAAH